MAVQVPALPVGGGEAMSGRGRVYMLVVAARHAALAYLTMFVPWLFRGVEYKGIEDVAALPTWGCVFLVIAVSAAGSAWLRWDKLAQAVLLASIGVTGAWMGSFVWAALDGFVSWTTFVAWPALILKDMVLLRNPLRDPFAGLYRRVKATLGM